MAGLTWAVERLIDLALEEDLSLGDVTSEATIPAEALGRGVFLAKEDLVLAGTAVSARVFERLGARCAFGRADGDRVARGETFGEAEGPMRVLLAAERTSLNFLQRLSGVATARREVGAPGCSTPARRHPAGGGSRRTPCGRAAERTIASLWETASW